MRKRGRKSFRSAERLRLGISRVRVCGRGHSSRRLWLAPLRFIFYIDLVRTIQPVQWFGSLTMSGSKLRLYIDLSERPSVESREISEGIVLDYDAAGNLVGIDIDNASRRVELKKLILNKLPAVVQNNSA
jgi:uncharacterized protein YuzE